MTAPQHVTRLERDLRAIFADRLESLVAYNLHPGAARSDHAAHHSAHEEPQPTHTLAIVRSLTGTDLKACADGLAKWHDAGLATPLILPAGEFERSLDVFPFEFGAIIADHVIVCGRDPFVGLTVDQADLRRACEVQVRSHLLHLREGFLETNGRGDAVAVLIVRSAAPFAALLASVARLQGTDGRDPVAAAKHLEGELQLAPGSITDVVRLAHVSEIPSAQAVRMFPVYLDAAERLVRHVDEWRARS